MSLVRDIAWHMEMRMQRGRNMSTVQWYFPETLDEAISYLGRDKTVIHGGGTSLIKSGIASFEGIVDLSKLGLNYLKADKGILEIGASTTFGEVAESLANLHPECILGKALGSAASTPMRNRITLGGSVSLLPLWSDLIGPMSVLHGVICTEGRNGGTYDLPAWIADRTLQRGSLVTSLLFPDAVDWRAYYHRETRVGFDYPSLTVSVLARKNNNTIEKVRIAVSGGLDRIRRLKELEERLSGADLSILSSPDLRKMASVEFGGKPAGSPEYLSEIAAVRVERALKAVLMEEES